MRSLSCFALAALASAALAGPAAAISMVVPLDQSTRLNVAGSAYSVLVGNPAVADVTVVDSHTLYISGRGYGSTDIVVLDRDGHTLYAGDLVVSSADAGRVSVYRGAQGRTDMACAPDCQVSVRSGGAGGSGGGGGGGGSPPAPSMANALGQAAGAAAPGGKP